MVQPRINSSPKSENDFLMMPLNASASHSANGKRIAKQSYFVFVEFLLIQKISEISAMLAPEKYIAIMLGAMNMTVSRRFTSMRFSFVAFNYK
jgi:hypothetical protein